MDWDKIWSINKRIIDPIAPRYSAINSKAYVVLNLENGPETAVAEQIDQHQKVLLTQATNKKCFRIQASEKDFNGKANRYYSNQRTVKILLWERKLR